MQKMNETNVGVNVTEDTQCSMEVTGFYKKGPFYCAKQSKDGKVTRFLRSCIRITKDENGKKYHVRRRKSNSCFQSSEKERLMKEFCEINNQATKRIACSCGQNDELIRVNPDMKGRLVVQCAECLKFYEIIMDGKTARVEETDRTSRDE